LPYFVREAVAMVFGRRLAETVTKEALPDIQRAGKGVNRKREIAAEAAEFVGQINEGLTPGKRSRNGRFIYRR
jgi:hypothetical protein